MRLKRKKKDDIEKILNRINEINKIKNDLNKEIEELRDKCPHNNKKIGYLLNSFDSYNITEICTDCGKILGPITELNIRNI